MQIGATPYLLALFLLTEYGLKEWMGSNTHVLSSRPALAYVAGRGVHFLLNLAGGALLIGITAHWVVTVLVIEALLTLELPLEALRIHVHRRFGISPGWIQLVPMAAVSTWTAIVLGGWVLSPSASVSLQTLIDALPGGPPPEAISSYVLGLVLAAHPAYHIIRCLVDKAQGESLLGLVLSRRAIAPVPGLMQAEVSSAGEDDASTLGGGQTSDAPQTPGAQQTPHAQQTPDAQQGPGVKHEASSVFSARETATLRAGRTIGILERWIIVILTVAGQFALIGLVLTAKSIARFKRFDQDQEFAEYYLLGTLYSTLIGLIVGIGLRYV